MNVQGLNLPIQYLKGVGPKKANLLKKIGIETVKEALYYLPSQYEDRRNKKSIFEIKPGEIITAEGSVVQINEIRTKTNLSIIEAIISDGTGFLKAKWFNQNYLKKILKEKKKLKLFGKVQIDYRGNYLEILNPEYELVEQTLNSQTQEIVPIYRLTEGLSQKQMQSIMQSAVEFAIPYIEEHLPENVIKKLKLPTLKEAIKFVHLPPNNADIKLLNEKTSDFHRRIIFDELFFLQLGILLIKQNRICEKGISFNPEGSLLKKFLENLPFKLTSAQQRVINEILEDMKKTIPMNRLLQGDVGSGKTVVAVAAMLAAIECGYQAALMAPTEILAEQHYLNISSLLKGLPINTLIYTSSYNKHSNLICSGAVNLIIGTHALIQEDIHFKNLGIVVIDEQHRFGVIQRVMLKKKGLNPDTLVMTATPIPRTMALTVYGDLDYSILDELPAGRKPILTKVIEPENKKIIYKMIDEEVSSGGQVYVVYPLIEESEAMDLKSATQGYEGLKKIFPQYKVALIHGKMSAKQREEIMKEFRNGDIHILVATTVIEVGVDVPNATLMIIIHAERFGLAQLHQLRGRVGRGLRPSKCILLPYKLTEEAKLRLRAIVNYSDGFKIAEEDMKIRGPGELFGVKQSGMPDLKVADLIKDQSLLEIARNEAEQLIQEDKNLSLHPKTRASLENFWKGKTEIFMTA
ncbi:ATP-dependent DNA helicase RecG [Thermodesulfovibrio yellowstonii]|uniref:ATP-dependent DNA helicase RecG n=1 Tax=Thermodesulfovibrio yellowstonii TaxID=28262 RepID=A0A9W6LK60_9BACT|nr:ATP-dependent DNA helicase RecG [Thermodesulfovibrio islandicus]GLI53911.1 ATP-dependent DNA helicase RecG [Thermodesulfovibrio islandicus]